MTNYPEGHMVQWTLYFPYMGRPPSIAYPMNELWLNRVPGLPPFDRKKSKGWGTGMEFLVSAIYLPLRLLV